MTKLINGYNRSVTPRPGRILLIAAAGSVMVGLVPEDVCLSLHVLGAF